MCQSIYIKRQIENPANFALAKFYRGTTLSASSKIAGMRATLPEWSMQACLVLPVANRSLLDSREIR